MDSILIQMRKQLLIVNFFQLLNNSIIPVRVEGNTDNTGDYHHNVELFKKRAQSVAKYLVKMELM